MSMIGCFMAIEERDLAALRARPGRIARWFFDEEPPVVDGGFLGLFKKTKPPPPDDWEPPEAVGQLDVDKAWHGIHFLLTGDAEGGDGPLAFILEGGTTIGAIDVGYGPARGFDPKETAAIAEALEAISPSDFQARYDAEQLAEHGVYPDIWDREDDDGFGYLREYFEMLTDFVTSARDEGRGLLVWLS